MAITASLGIRTNTNKLLENRFESRSLVPDKQSFFFFFSHSTPSTHTIASKLGQKRSEKKICSKHSEYMKKIQTIDKHIYIPSIFLRVEVSVRRELRSKLPHNATLMCICVKSVLNQPHCKWNILGLIRSICVNVCMMWSRLLFRVIKMRVNIGKIRSKHDEDASKTKTAYFENVFYVIYPVARAYINTEKKRTHKKNWHTKQFTNIIRFNHMESLFKIQVSPLISTIQIDACDLTLCVKVHIPYQFH